MRLLIDSGNTRVKYGVSRESKISMLSGIQEATSILENCSEIIYAAVAIHEELELLLKKARKLGLKVTRVTTEAERFGIKCAYPTHQNLGVDRWLGIVAAKHLFPSDYLIVIDSGTAVTIDIVTYTNQHVGGWIMPGLELMQSAISQKAPGVFRDAVFEREIFGTNTPSALNSGCTFALVGAIEKAIALVVNTGIPQQSIKIVLTGGDAPTLKKLLQFEIEFVPDLLLIGLNQY